MFRKSKSFASELLPKSFKAEKCKIALKLVRTRLTLTKSKKGIQVKQMRRDIAMLLEAGQDQTALIRVEHVITEENTLYVYELIDIYSELIIARLPIIESKKNCPTELREAISSVIFASSRCADIPEIIDVRKQFVAKYGKEFIIAALEVRPECGVSSMLVEKLSARAPDSKTKMKTLSSIAEEFKIKWDIKSLEDQNHMPSDDALAGPKTSASAGQTLMELPNANYSPTPSRMKEQSERLSQNDTVSKTPTFKDSTTRSSIYTMSMPSTPSHSRVSENRGSRSGWEEENSAYQTESTSLNQQNWNMGFKDATSAAQAAAESAERASVAARAAAELARRESASYNEIKQNIKESVALQFNEIKQSSESVMVAEDRNTDEAAQARSEKAGRRNCDNMNPSRSFSYSPSYSHEEVNRKNEGRPYGYATFDDSDGQSSDGGDAIDNIMREEEMKSTNLYHDHMFPDNVEFISSPLPDINYPGMSYDSNTEEKERLSLGRLTGGFRNKGFPDPPYLRDPLPGSPVPSKPVHTRAMEGCLPSQEKSLEPNLHCCRSDASPSGVFRGFDKFRGSDLNHSCGRKVYVTESSPTMNRVARNDFHTEEQTGFHQNKASTNSENLVYDSYSLKPMARDGNSYGSRAYGHSKSALLPPKEINIAPSVGKYVSFSERAFSGREVPDEEFPYQRQTVRANREPANCFDQDAVKAEPQYTLGFRSDGCANIYRTRDLPSAIERGSVYGYQTRSNANSEIESQFFGGSFTSESPNTENRGMHLDRRDSSRSSEQNISLKQSSMTPSNGDSLLRKENLNKSQVNSEASKIPSRESSLKSVSHVHPKLPDYDTIVAHFQALRANRH